MFAWRNSVLPCVPGVFVCVRVCFSQVVLVIASSFLLYHVYVKNNTDPLLRHFDRRTGKYMRITITESWINKVKLNLVTSIYHRTLCQIKKTVLDIKRDYPVTGSPVRVINRQAMKQHSRMRIAFPEHCSSFKNYRQWFSVLRSLCEIHCIKHARNHFLKHSGCS